MGIVKKTEMKLVDDVPREPKEPEDTQQVTFKVDPNTQTTFQYDVVKKALCDLVSATMEYLECKDHMEYKKATYLIHTDWKEALPLHSRPTVGDKEAYIKEVTYDKQKHLRALYVDKMMKEELYKLELLRYEKE